MALDYLKLANVTVMVSNGQITRAALLAGMALDDTEVVNLKGRMLTAAQVASHLDGTVDGETVIRL